VKINASIIDGPTDVETKIHCTPHPGEHIHRHPSDSRCNPSTQIWKRFYSSAVHNKLLVYKTILKPIWTYGIPLWGSASTSDIEILQRFQNKVIRAIVNAQWYVPNGPLHADLRIPTLREEVTKISWKYKGKITTHTNELATIRITKR
jgi:hypothetical protein